MRRIYDYLIFDISKIKSGREREKEEIARIRRILTELRGAFEQASCKAGAGGQRMVQDSRILG